MVRHIGCLILFILIGASILTSPTTAFAKENDWMVILLSGDSLSNCSLDSLQGTDLFIHRADSKTVIALDSVMILIHRQPSQAVEWTLVGVVAGGLIGLVESSGSPYRSDWGLGPPPRSTAMTFGGLFCGACGYWFGSKLGGDKAYDLHERSMQGKIRVIEYLLQGGD